MQSYTYTKSVGKISSLFNSIVNKGIPTRATVQWLKSIGFTSSNDQSLIPLLKSLKFVDDSGAPTDLWSRYRSSNGRQVLAEAIRATYEDLFSTHPNANNLLDSELSLYFRANTKAGDDTVRRTVSTFNELVKLADFESGKEGGIQNGQNDSIDDSPIRPNVRVAQSPSLEFGTIETTGQSLTINLNVELQIPATDDQNVYEAFFAAMRKHLLNGGN